MSKSFETLHCEEGDDVCTFLYNLLQKYNRQLEALYTIYRNSNGNYASIPFDDFINLAQLQGAVENGIKIAQSAEDPDQEVLNEFSREFKKRDAAYIEIASAVKSLHLPVSRYFFDPNTGEINDISVAPRARLSNFRNPERLAIPRAFSRNIANEANFYDDWIEDYLYE